MKNINELIFRATQGDPQAQLDLGYAYLRGEGIDKNIDLAISWWKKLAEITNPYDGERDDYTDEEYDAYEAAAYYMSLAQYELGYHYFHGIGVEQNQSEAINWFLRAASNDSPHAMNDLGECYFHGCGVEQDYSEALEWFRGAADMWHPTSQYYLGLMHLEGKGVEANKKIAANWFLLAARGFLHSGKINYESFEFENAKKFYKKAIEALKQAEKLDYAEAKYKLNNICYYSEMSFDKMDRIDLEYIRGRFEIIDSIPWQISFGDYFANKEHKAIPISVKEGNKVYHKSFGEGIVKKMNGNELVIDFGSAGKKTFLNPNAIIDGYLYITY
ncbi:MAG: SEL1-like repeat protein [Clostridia bacterium]|nr:SEL1-like repeat protein [Clostridia bacterium]